MSKYEFSLRQEVLMEKGAGIVGDIFHYLREHNIEPGDDSDPVYPWYGKVWNAKEDVLSAQTYEELDAIDAFFDDAKRELIRLGVDILRPPAD